MCTKRDKLDETSKGKFTDVVSANVDVSGVFAADWIGRHGHSRQISNSPNVENRARRFYRVQSTTNILGKVQPHLDTLK